MQMKAKEIQLHPELILSFDGISLLCNPECNTWVKILSLVKPVCCSRLYSGADSQCWIPCLRLSCKEHLFDLLIAHCLLSVLLPISLPSSSVQVMACHREIIGCHTAVITCRNCLQALD